MNRTLAGILIAAGALLAADRPAAAHHSRALFDVARNVTYQGVVKEYRWQNPHSHIVITVEGGASDPLTAGTWDVEASSTSLMISQGWSRATYRPGDRITVVAHPARDGSRLILLFYAVRADGRRLYRAGHRYPSEVG